MATHIPTISSFCLNFVKTNLAFSFIPCQRHITGCIAKCKQEFDSLSNSDDF